MSTVIMERLFTEPVSDSDIAGMKRLAEPCFEINDVELLHGFVSLDRKRFCCVFEARDAASVQRAIDSAGLTYERIWGADDITTMKLPDV